ATPGLDGPTPPNGASVSRGICRPLLQRRRVRAGGSMRVVMFYHSLVSDWNHGNAHFLRGVVPELLRGGTEVSVSEPADSWSRQHLIQEHGPEAVTGFRQASPGLSSRQ